MSLKRLTLGRALAAGLVSLALLAALLLGVVLAGWRQSLLESAGRLRDEAAERAGSMVAGSLKGAAGALRDIEQQLRGGVVDAEDPRALESVLFARVVANSELAEATFTRDPAGGGFQVSVFREGGEAARIVTRSTRREGHGSVAEERTRVAGSSQLAEAAFARVSGAAPDPTEHVTFAATVAHQRFSEAPLWTDLHYAESDGLRPESERRVVVTVMKAITDKRGVLVGVVRVGLLAEHLDAVTRLHVESDNPADPHRVFLADARGRLITRLRPGHALLDEDGELRATTEGIPEEVRLALSRGPLREVSAERPRLSARLLVDGRPYLVSARALPETQDWRIGVVVPEDHYLGGLDRTRRMLLGVSALALLAMIVAGGLALRSVQAGLTRIVQSAARMRDFDFSASASPSTFRDVEEVMEDLEQAKTALRAMGKYVPVALVRQLYRARLEPRLGGELRELTILFTDIRDFTSFSERLAPDALAAALGCYLEAMTGAVHAHGGTVDKYVGDAVMALWNAPESVVEHTGRACAAALACREATEALFASPAWQGLPAFYTRFGLHRDEVMVGHFGAPDRLSYTALGDGVNLASRLEGLNKAYGTQILVSEAVRQAAGAAFAFRLIDVVAVKGRSQGVRVYELLGPAGPTPPELASYERAFEAYQQRRFAEALGLLEAASDDPPSQVLASRCRRFLATPPGADWDGIFIAHEK